MIKKLNQYLLENHPLIWNTRFVWLMLGLLGMHVLFFVIGYFSYSSPVQLHDHDFFEGYFSSGFVWIGVLISILILILWLNQYFKQNAFKSHYPKKSFSLYKEFLIIFLVSLLSISQYFSYTYGLKMRVSGMKSTTELEKEIDWINRAGAFTFQLQGSYYQYNSMNAYDPTGYNPYSRCMAAPVFDTLVDRDRVVELFVKNKIANNVYGWSRLNPENYKLYRDSIDTPIWQNQEYETVLLEKFPNRRNWKMSYDFQKNPEIYGETGTAYGSNYVTTSYDTTVAATSDQPTEEYNLRSIYNYCSLSVAPSDTMKNAQYYAEKTAALLNAKNKDSIQLILNSYQKLADEYEVGYRFKDKSWLYYVFNPPYYFVDYELQNPSYYNDVSNKVFKKDYVAHADMVNTLENLKKSKSSVFESYTYLIILYLALAISLLIYTFRITSMRTWVVALVGAIVVFLIYLCIFFLFSISILPMSESFASILFLIFACVFFVFGLGGILQGRRKLISGVNFIWSIWVFGAILPVCVGLYTMYLNWKYPYRYDLNQSEHPHLTWISSHWELILFINLALIFIYILLVLPLMKKWQAMAEE